MAQNLTINGYNLQDSRYITSKIDHEGLTVNLSEQQVPHRPGAKLTNFTYGARSILVEGHIFATTASGLDGLIDELKQNLIGAMAVPLVTDYLGTSRQYTVNVKSLAIARDFYNTTMVPYSIQCEAINSPFGISPTTISGYSQTTISGSFSITSSGIITNDTLTILGTAYPLPQVVFTITTSGSISALQFTNTSTNTSFLVNVNASNGDKVIVDTSNYVVKQNITPITTYSGTYPTFAPGVNSFTITAFGKKPNFAYGVSVEYNPSYL